MKKILTHICFLFLTVFSYVNIYAQDQMDKDGLNRIITNNDLDSLKQFLQNGENLLHIEHFKQMVRQALSTATQYNKTDALEIILLYQTSPLNPTLYLWHAVYAGSPNAADFWLRRGAEVESYYNSVSGHYFMIRETPLMRSAIQGNLELAKILVAHGADINKRGEQELTPLIFASQSGNLELVIFLIEQKADMHAVDYQKKNVLMHAAYCGNNDIIDFYISQGFSINSKDKYNRTPLIITSLYSFDEMSGSDIFEDLEERVYQTTKLLVERGADINVKDFEGMTALMFAVSGGYLKVVEYLLSQGANLGDINNFGDSVAVFYNPWSFAYYGEDRDEHLKKFESLLKLVNIDYEQIPSPKIKSQMDKDIELLDAIIKNDVDKVKKAINTGASLYPDWEQDYMGSMMFRALNSGASIPILKLLIESGAFVNEGNIYGTTALMRAVMGSDYDAVAFLIDKGACINLKNQYGNTALIFAAKNGDAEMINLLLKHGADINAIGNGTTAIDIARENNKIEVVKLLESKGAKTLEELKVN
ncbi:ankyrin repeat domain-containing protein [Dysgonomonas sp. Marseille-P4361]|uniref:ankyrin repeat domain-containing protein n=1 Tax=Dysgonomonas sp. Marseille-P4361 TaxID=2161820 RepID=UPI000D55F2A4|nr:ankyrin repeat domain-containing protein [Dysgonomonas sp. Marseille-P4361]